MDHRDLEMTDIMVIFDDGGPGTMDVLIANLKTAGVAVGDVDAENGVIEGTIETTKLKSIEKLPSVKYVRSVFNYVADFPAGEVGGQDESDREDDDLPD